MKRGAPLQRKTPMPRGKGLTVSRPFPGTVRLTKQTRPRSTHDDGTITLDLPDTPQTRYAVEEARRALANRQRSIEAGSPALAAIPDAPKRLRKGDGSFSKATKAAILKRDGGCVGCGVTEGLNFQHRQARGMGGTSDPAVSAVTNGILLCGSGTTGCHGWAESHPEAAEDHGWSVPQWADPASVPVLHHRLGWIRLSDNGEIIVTREAPPQHCATMVAVRKADS